MNERRRRRRSGLVDHNIHQSSLYILVFTLVFCVFLVWLWFYSSECIEHNTRAPNFANVEVREWLDSNELLEMLKNDQKFYGKKGINERCKVA